MKIVILRSFERDFQKLSKELRRQTLKKIEHLKTHRDHPSLRTKKIKGYERIWEGSVTMAYRFTYHVDESVIYLRRVGTHSILNKP